MITAYSNIQVNNDSASVYEAGVYEAGVYQQNNT